MQSCLRPIRKMMGYTMVEFGEAMGLTRQQINNIEQAHTTHLHGWILIALHVEH